MRTIVGIDPGKTGGLCIFPNGDRAQARAYAMPLVGKDIHRMQIKIWFEEWHPGLVVMEKVGAMPKQGVASTFTFGRQYGILIGLCTGMEIPLEQITPQTWKRDVLKGTKKDKDAAAEYCAQAFPQVPIILPRCRKAHTGITDAICITEYGVRHYG